MLTALWGLSASVVSSLLGNSVTVSASCFWHLVLFYLSYHVFAQFTLPLSPRRLPIYPTLRG